MSFWSINDRYMLVMTIYYSLAISKHFKLQHTYIVQVMAGTGPVVVILNTSMTRQLSTSIFRLVIIVIPLYRVAQ